MNEFQSQLAELFDLQRALDQRILGDKSYPLQQMIIAFIAEVGELLKEAESLYKHWKKSPVDNRQRMLEEYVDCLHFAISITDYDICEENFFEYGNYQTPKFKLESCGDFLIETGELGMMLKDLIENIGSFDGLWEFLNFANVLGLEWPEIYTEYKRKNAINHQRQEEGY